MKVISGAMREDSGGLFAQLSSYRHKVFVETLGWELQTQNGWELDQFDRPDTVYVVSQNGDGQINGCARLLPTDQPYLLGEVFPELFNGQTPPCSQEVWELSRFAAMDFSGHGAAVGGKASDITVDLLRQAIACVAAHGGKKMIAVSTRSVERLMRSAGFQMVRMGPPVVINGFSLVACWLDVEENLARFPADYEFQFE
ncbi:MAG: acyl-homoserine-lactone synthase [Pseudomonadota bacterium]